MSVGRISVRAVTPDVAARPGEIVECTLRVRNDGPSAVPLAVRVHGLGQSSPYVPIAGPPLAPGAEVDVEVPLEVPESFGIGAHSLAVEIGSGKPQDRSALAKVLLTIGAPAGITTRIEPSVVRGGRRTKFDVEVHNSSAARADVALQSSAPDVRIRLAQRQITVDPGSTVAVRAKVRGPRRWVGDPAQHVLSVEARSGSVPIYATASYRQRALLPRRARGGMIGIAFLALWALIAAAVVLVWARRDDESNQDATEQVAAGQSLTPLTNPDGSPASGDGSGGSGGGGAGGGAGGAGADAAGSDAVTDTIVRGTVKAGDTGADDGVLVTLTPTVPGESQQVATGSTSGPTAGDQPAALLQPGGPGDGMRIVPAARPAGSDAAPAKFWPARYGTYRPGGLDNVRTLSVSSVASGVDGSWQFQQVPLRQSYEVSFAKPGYTTQSFIVSPADDGEPVELEVELEPGDGALAGTVTGPPGAAQVTVTDGTLTFNTTTSTDADTHGRWAIDSLSTPGTYTITVTSHSFGTEVMQVHLDAGEERSGLDLGLSPNVGSISGTVTAGGAVRGGVTLVATAGDDEITTTSVTEGATGTYSFPQMALGGTYTITASADGYITQTRSVTVDGNTTGIDFALVKSTASIVGRVLSSKEGTTAPLVSAAVTVGAGELQVRTNSAAAPDAGAFSVTDLPPGTYVLAASRYDHPEVSQLVTLTAGQVFDAGDIVLGYQTRPPLTATGSLIVRTVDSNGVELPGATVQLIDVGGTIPTQSKTMAPTESSVSFTAIPISTYTVRVTKPNYRPATIDQLSIGLGPVERQLTMLQYGTARGTVIDAVAGYEYNGAQVYVTADDPGKEIEFDRGKPLLLPPESQIGPGATAAYRTTNIEPELFDLLVVEYEGGLFVLDTNNDGVPDQPLTLLRVGSRPLSGYELLLYRMNGATPVCIGPIPETAAEWEIDPTMQLLSGSYALRFNPLDGEGAGTACAGRGRAPTGYATIPSDAAGNVATFTVADDLDRKILLDPIPVAPYTQISGRVLVPRIDSGTVVFDDFDAAQAAGLSVVLDCDAAAGTVQATIAPGPGTAVTFTLSREQIQTLLGPTPYDPTTGVIGACYLNTSYSASSEFIPVETPVTVAVGLGPPSYPDRTVSVALVDDPGIITGTVWWRDLGATGAEPSAYTVAGATVASDEPVIVGFTPAVEDDPNDPDSSVAPTVTPSEQPVAVSATADANGLFAFAAPADRQVLGTSAYTVNATSQYGPVFVPGSLQVTAEPGAWSATGTPPQSVVDNGSAVDVFLDPPAGSINGNVSITTNRTNRPYGELQLTPTAPGGTPGTVVTPDGSGSYRIDNAAAGTWQLAWAEAPGSNLLVTSSTPVRQFVDAGQPAVAPTATAVELGQIDVALTDDVGGAIDGGAGTPSNADDSTVTVVQQAGPATQPASYTSIPQTPSATGTASFPRLPVSAANPLGQDITYLVSAVVPKHDEPTSHVYVTRVLANGQDGPEVELTAFAGSMTNIPVTVRAGERVKVRFATPGYARIEGKLTGLTTPPGLSPAATEPLIVGPDARVTLTRDNDTEYEASAVGADGSFAIDVPAGTYTITYAATNYVSPPGPISLGLLTPDSTTTPTQNADLDKQLVLQARTYTLTALASTLAGAAGVDGAAVRLYWGAIDPLAPPAATSSGTTVGGSAIIGAVYPGVYTLIVRKQSGAPLEDENFPVIATITIPRVSEGGNPAHTVVMPPVGGSITGQVRAESSVQRPLPLPANLTVTRSYDAAQLGAGDPDYLPNQATDQAIVQPPVPELPVTETSPGVGTYLFERLPYGEHVLTYTPQQPPGFQTLVPNQRTIAVGGPETAADVVYIAKDVPVVIDVHWAGDTLTAVPGATVSLIAAVPGPPNPGNATFSDGAYRYSGVPPDVASYTLRVQLPPGYQPVADRLVEIAPSDVPLAIDVPVTPIVKITGTAQVRGAAGTVGYAGTVALQLLNGSEVATTTSDSTGAYSFELTSAPSGPVQVAIAPADHEPASAEVNSGTAVALGNAYMAPTVTAVEHATAHIALTNPASASGITLTVSPHDGVSGDGTITTDNEWDVTGLKADLTYTYTITAADYESHPPFTHLAAAGEPYAPDPITLVGKPATAIISAASVTPAATNVQLAVLEGGSPASGLSGTSGSGPWTVTDLTPGVAYTFRITSDNYTAADVVYTFGPNETKNFGARALSGKPASATISAASVTPAATNVQLAVLVGGSPASGLSGTSGSGPWTVTGLTPGVAYTFRITSDNYTAADVVYTFDPNETKDFGTQTLTGKPATATITVGGPDGDKNGMTVTCSSGIIGVRSSPPANNIWTFTIPVGQACIFTAAFGSATASGPAAPGYVGTPRGTFSLTLTPA